MNSALSRFLSLGISRDDFVLELGSGNRPYWRSDLLIDKYVSDASERPGKQALLIIDRPFIVGDALQLPFQDNSVDFVIARNIIEHIADIEALFCEFMRVARGGYFTAPSAIAEKLFGWDKHVWFTTVEDGELRLVAKDKPIYDSNLSTVFHSLYASDRQFRKFYRNHPTFFVTEYLWKDVIRYSIKGEVVEGLKQTQAVFDYQNSRTALMTATSPPSIRSNLQRVFRALLSCHKAQDALSYIDRLGCPICHRPLYCDELGLLCKQCEIHYPLVNHVPILVREAAF